MSWEVRQGDCLSVLGGMESELVQTCVTSPPYWGLRDYGTATWEGGDPECDHMLDARARRDSPGGFHNSQGDRSGETQAATVAARSSYRDVCGKCGAQRIDSQLGLELTPEQYVENLVAVMREVRRVLRKDGTLWLNLGDSYYAAGWESRRRNEVGSGSFDSADRRSHTGAVDGLKVKDLVGIPWRVAFALQADGWWLRSDIVWSKPNPMPESVTDRPTRAHEYIFLLTKSQRYFYDADAIAEPSTTDGPMRWGANGKYGDDPASKGRALAFATRQAGDTRNRRSVWEVATQPYPEAHFATFPPKLVEPCILAGSAEDDTVLDPFAGSGTTGVVALRHHRSFVGVELNPDYCELARNRIRDDAPLFNYDLEVAA